MKRNLTQTGKILQILDKSFGLTFAEVCNRLNESRDATRKSLHYLYKEGRVTRATDADGIVHYNVTDKGREHLKRELSGTDKKPMKEQVPTSKMWKEDTSVIKNSHEAWTTLIAEAEQRGFAKGYIEGAKAMQRAAYEDGRQAVINKLGALLS